MGSYVWSPRVDNTQDIASTSSSMLNASVAVLQLR